LPCPTISSTSDEYKKTIGEKVGGGLHKSLLAEKLKNLVVKPLVKKQHNIRFDD
jgi:hypothetical protein